MSEVAEKKKTLSEAYTSKEEHLREYWKLIQEGKTLRDARGKSKTAKYATLNRLRKAHKCPYDKEEGELYEAWNHLKKHFPVDKLTDAQYLKQFAKRYEEKNHDLDLARGGTGTYLFNSLKKIIDEDLHFPELAEEEALLRRVWKYESRLLSDQSTQQHLQDFVDEYESNGHDYKKARGIRDSPRYVALKRLRHKNADEYDEPYKSQIKKVQELWEEQTSWQEHLQDFIDDESDGYGFYSARGTNMSARYQALLTLKNKNADEYDEPYKSQIKKLQELWEEQTSWQEHLQTFIDEYESNGHDFVKARGIARSRRYHMLLTLKNKNADEYDEPYKSQIKKLQEVWGVAKTADDLVAQMNEQLNM